MTWWKGFCQFVRSLWYDLVYILCMVGWLIHVNYVNDTNLFMLNPIYFCGSKVLLFVVWKGIQLWYVMSKATMPAISFFCKITSMLSFSLYNVLVMTSLSFQALLRAKGNLEILLNVEYIFWMFLDMLYTTLWRWIKIFKRMSFYDFNVE